MISLSTPLHAAVVHLPIVLIPLSLIFVCLQIHQESKPQKAIIFVFASILSGWLSMITGNWEDGEVGSSLCDPTVLKSHENLSHNAMIMYSVAAGLYLISFYRYRKLLGWLSALLMLVATGIIFYSAHLGGKLVYEQAAGVEVPSTDCDGF